MLSISASTCAISASAAGVSVVLGSSALTTSAPGTATNAAPNIKPATKAFIQRDRDIEAPPWPAGREIPATARTAERGDQSIYRRADRPHQKYSSQRSVRIATFSLRDDPAFTK